jgi:hypothetical protein
MLDTLGEVARYLWVEGHLADEEIAEVLGYAPDTPRRRRLVDWGHMLYAEGMDALEGTEKERLMAIAPPLPRVHGSREDPPRYSKPAIPEPHDRRDARRALLSHAKAHIAKMEADGEVRYNDKADGKVRRTPKPGSPDAKQVMAAVLEELGVTDEEEFESILAAFDPDSPENERWHAAT